MIKFSSIPYLTHPLLRNYEKLHHGFMTRQGGVSTGVHSSLNCSLSQKDSPENVLENRTRVASLFQKPLEKLKTVHQVHSGHVVVASASFPSLTHVPEADGLVTKEKGLLLGILSADCAPVLLFDPVHEVVGAAHAGWQGVLKGIIGHTVQEMVALGAKVSHMVAIVGPCIQQNSYEVNQEFREGFLSKNLGTMQWFEPASRQSHWLFNLRGYVISCLQEAGVPTIDFIDKDTLTEEDSFFSYRRSVLLGQEVGGRQISIIGME